MNSKTFDVALFLIRAGIGIVLAAHGAQKVLGLFGGTGIEGFADMLSGIGMPFPFVMAWVAGLAELLGGIFVISGFMPRTGAFLIAVVMAVAIIKVHGGNGFFMNNGGFEYPFLIFMNALAIIFSGGGEFSVYNRY